MKSDKLMATEHELEVARNKTEYLLSKVIDVQNSIHTNAFNSVLKHSEFNVSFRLIVEELNYILYHTLS